MLIHYIIVRRDLPLGVLAAMVTHAAGESAAQYYTNGFDVFDGATAVVLQAKSEQQLVQYIEYLSQNKIKFITVRESSSPYMGQFMAIGVVPGPRETLTGFFREFQCLKDVDKPSAQV